MRFAFIRVDDMRRNATAKRIILSRYFYFFVPPFRTDFFQVPISFVFFLENFCCFSWVPIKLTSIADNDKDLLRYLVTILKWDRKHVSVSR